MPIKVAIASVALVSKKVHVSLRMLLWDQIFSERNACLQNNLGHFKGDFKVVLLRLICKQIEKFFCYSKCIAITQPTGSNVDFSCRKMEYKCMYAEELYNIRFIEVSTERIHI